MSVFRSAMNQRTYYGSACQAANIWLFLFLFVFIFFQRALVCKTHKTLSHIRFQPAEGRFKRKPHRSHAGMQSILQICYQRSPAIYKYQSGRSSRRSISQLFKEAQILPCTFHAFCIAEFEATAHSPGSDPNRFYSSTAGFSLLGHVLADSPDRWRWRPSPMLIRVKSNYRLADMKTMAEMSCFMCE